MRTQLSVAAVATAAVGGMVPTAADSSTPAKTADVAHFEKLDTKAPSLTYRAASHDTLKTVVRRTRVSPTVVTQANELTGPLRMGQRLEIPSIPEVPKTPLPAEPSSSLSHTVQQGDTLSGIARQHGTTIAAIAQASGVAGPARIYARKTLTIPGAATEALVTPQNPIPKTFPHYIYPDPTNSAANTNKLTFEGAAVPPHAQMQEIVRSTAVQIGIDPKLALTHAYVESGFDTRSVSPVNTIDVVQVIPSLGEWASRLVGRRLSLLDPRDNAVADIAIIRYLQSSADSVDRGIADYYQDLGGMRRNGVRPDATIYINRVKAAQARF